LNFSGDKIILQAKVLRGSYKLFGPFAKCSSTLRELIGQGSLKTEGVVDRPMEFRELSKM